METVVGTRRHCSVTPLSSPHMLGKTGSKKIKILSPCTLTQSPLSPLPPQIPVVPLQPPPCNELDYFYENSKETSEVNKLQFNLYAYTCIKHAPTYTAEQTI